MGASPSRRLLTSQFLLGIIVILLGLLLLLETTGVVETADLLVYTPSLFVLVGFWALYQSRFRNVVGPLVLVGIGVAAQLVALGYATVDEMVTFWPLLLVAFGLSILLGQVRTRVRETDDAFTSAFAVFGGVEKRITSLEFLGGDLTAIFGGTELALRNAGVSDPPARVNAVAIFGGVEVVVPRDWTVQLDVLPVLGGASDDRPRRPPDQPRDEIDLVVTGFAAFGSVTVVD